MHWVGPAAINELLRWIKQKKLKLGIDLYNDDGWQLPQNDLPTMNSASVNQSHIPCSFHTTLETRADPRTMSPKILFKSFWSKVKILDSKKLDLLCF